jgi:ABC-type transporter Mla subunit MlaD
MKLDRVEAAVIIGLGVALALFVLAGLQACGRTASGGFEKFATNSVSRAQALAPGSTVRSASVPK